MDTAKKSVCECAKAKNPGMEVELLIFYLALFVKIVVFKTKRFKVDWSEDPTGVYAEEAHRPPRGKRACGGEINHTALLGK
ncbi:hypothetical protein [Peribacillus simplex]|uniref:hypothetical protein n=1 Tax=Peribacillus simplex TaxID=1478 RepID=UPI0036DD54C2